MQIAYKITDGEIVDVITIADDASPPENYATDDTIPAGTGVGCRLIDGVWIAPAPPAATLDDRRATALAGIASTADALLAGGAPVTDGLHVALDDGSRADLTAMAATATAAASGAVTWPDSYSRGWISIENVRIPLPVPAAGLALAAVVGDWYARVVQHRRDLKDQVLAAADEAALDAIDIAAGWPA